ncbi:MAG TPA: hypothetical protein PKY50_14535 [Candidatus Competibacter sp.]|nr:hypothetical protein [Candidatus Competibacter sp.]
MAGSTYEQFSTPSAFTRVNPGIALQWILNNVPCFSGTVPVEWTRAVYREASRWKVDFFILQVALKMAGKHGYVFAEEPVHAAKAGDILSQWQARKAEFLAVASSPNYLNARQLFHIWQQLWQEEMSRGSLDEDRLRKQINKRNPAVYADNMDKFEHGKRDALGPEYQDAADRLDTARFMLTAATDLLNWLEARVDTMGDRYTLQQVNERAFEIANTWSKIETWFMPVIIGVLGMASMKGSGMGGFREGRVPERLGSTPTAQHHLPPEPVPDTAVPPNLSRHIQGDNPAVRLGRVGQPGNLFARVETTGEGVTYRVSMIVLRGEGSAAEIQLARSAHRAMIRRAAELARRAGASTFKLVGEQASPNFVRHANELAEKMGIPKSGKATSKIAGAYSDYEVTLRVDLVLKPSSAASPPPLAPTKPPTFPSSIPPTKKDPPKK